MAPSFLQARGTVQGWLFDLYPSRNGMVLWIINADGRAIRGTAPFTPYFLLAINDGDRTRLEQIAPKIGCRVAPGWTERTDLYTQKTIQCAKVLVPDPIVYRATVRKFEPYFDPYAFYNADISPEQAFLYRSRLFPFARGVFGFSDDGALTDLEINDTFDSVSYELPPLTVMQIRPEFGGLAPKYQRALRIEIEYDHHSYLLEGESGAEVIDSLNRHLDRWNPDVIISRFGDHTILPMIDSIARQVKRPIHLHRDPAAAPAVKRDISYWSYGHIVHRAGAFELAGRLHIDAENSFIVDQSDLAGLFDLARLTRIPIQTQARSSIGTGLSSLQLAWAYEHDILIPSKKQEFEKFKSASQLLLADRGGMIFLPIPGYHQNVGELDFTSMYPSLMANHNISPETVLCGCCSEPKVPELQYPICSRRNGIVPETLRPVLAKRALYKQLKKSAVTPEERRDYDRRQSALKWMLVTSFGYLGYKNARFGKIEAHESVNAFSRRSLLTAKRIAEENGFRVLHAIVDCLWLTKDGATSADFERISALVSDEVGVALSFEGIYRWILFPSSRVDPLISTANRYVGSYTTGEVKVRGLELRRHDAPRFIKDTQADLLSVLKDAGNLDELRTLVPPALDAVRLRLDVLRSGRINPADLVITRTVSKEAEEYQGNSIQAIIARTMAEAGVPLKPGESAQYIILDASGKKFPHKAAPLALYNPVDGFDTEKYTELTIDAIEGFFSPLGINRAELERRLIPESAPRRSPATKTRRSARTDSSQLTIVFD